MIIHSMSKTNNDGKYDDEMKRHDVTILPLRKTNARSKRALSDYCAISISLANTVRAVPSKSNDIDQRQDVWPWGMRAMIFVIWTLHCAPKQGISSSTWRTCA